MQTIVNAIFSPAELFMAGAMISAVFVVIGLVIRAAAKACTVENGKKLAVGSAKVAGKTAGKIAGKAVWHAIKSRTGI